MYYVQGGQICYTFWSYAESLARLRTLAAQEGTIERLWGRNCFTRAMDSLGVSHCRHMTPETASRLALALANCHLAMLGQQQHTCSQKTSLQQCTDSFPDDRSFETYIAQLSHIDRYGRLGFMHCFFKNKYVEAPPLASSYVWKEPN